MSSFFEVKKGSDRMLGAGGGTIYVAAANGITGNFIGLQALEDSVIDLNESSFSAQAGQNLNNIPLKAGVTIVGSISNWDLISGKVAAYSQF